jgi:hypothetical protein
MRLKKCQLFRRKCRGAYRLRSVSTTRADVTPGGAALAMKASNFAFDPNMVSVHGTGVITVTIT